MRLPILNTLSLVRQAFPKECIKCSKTRLWFSTSTYLKQHTEETSETGIAGVGPHHAIRRNLPLVTSRKLQFPSKQAPKQAWVETLEQAEDNIVGIVDLHPEIFGLFPRIDVLWWNVFWQRNYRRIDYQHAKTRAEMPGGGRKPWQQKRTGRARHGSIRSPLWVKGGKSFGPRGPKSHFFMLPDNLRVLGLRTALTVKYAQDNLHIIENLNLPTDDPKYLMDLVEARDWGLSVLFVDDTDFINKNMAIATNEIKQYNVMPVYGLNVYSMLKHETLILTLDALEKIEEKLLQHVYNVDYRDKRFSAKIVGPRV